MQLYQLEQAFTFSVDQFQQAYKNDLIFNLTFLHMKGKCNNIRLNKGICRKASSLYSKQYLNFLSNVY